MEDFYQEGDEFNSSSSNMLRVPWRREVQVAIEDEETPHPSSFPSVLEYMEQGHDAAVEAYLNLFDSHVAEEFAAETDVLELLRTKGVLVFVPHNWDGINGIEPLEIDWIEGLPAFMKPAARPINPKLYQNAKTEFERLKTYFYVPCNSPIASPLVVAPKATTPFIRLCGDYVKVNRFIAKSNTPIPHVIRTILDRIGNHHIFLDIDMTNSFHQFPLAELTSHRLSIQTPWEQVRPLFLPEGVPVASGHLQKVMSAIFADFWEWCIVIYDNILILCNSYADAYTKLDLFLQRCIDRNVTMKFAKSWLGFQSVKFFGYICEKGKFSLAPERKEALEKIPFPTTTKSMQSFLGFALFFKPFVPNYSALAAPLHDMTKKDFDWNQSTWVVGFYDAFKRLIEALQNAMALHYHDPSKTKRLRTDASETGVGAVLFQEFFDDATQQLVLEPIACSSQKFSDAATRWTTIEQECYGIYHGTKTFAYFLYGNNFIIETDHNNLRWMELSEVPKIIRWCAYLQSFNFMVHHIPGRHNQVADYLSRMLLLFQYSHPNLVDSLDADEGHVWESSFLHTMAEEDHVRQLFHEDATETDLVQRIMRACHNSRGGHMGARRTYLLANKLFPGHRIPMKVFQEFVATCPMCQKFRIGMVDGLEPIYRHLKPEHQRSRIGIDTLEVSPRDKNGNLYIDVVVNHFTKYTQLYPKGTHDAISIATSIFQYFCTYGIFDVVISDPGSDLTSVVFEHLLRWLGPQHVFSLVDRHESNGVEGTNKQILRHLKILVNEERIKDDWSSPTVLPIIQFLINSSMNSESGVIPLHATFGSQDAIYMRLPEDGKGISPDTHSYVRLLDENLQNLRVVSKRFQDSLVDERTRDTPAQLQNQYQPGDFVFFDREHLPEKLASFFLGPYEVVFQEKNVVHCRNLIQGDIKIFHVTRLKPFIGTKDEAFQLALRDNDQFEVDKIIAHRGDPKTRTTMEFEIRFMDGSCKWLPYSSDIFQMLQFEDYCREQPGLYFLSYNVKAAAEAIKAINKMPITLIQPGDVVYVDIRTYNDAWFQTIGLPDMFHIRYVVEWHITQWKKEPLQLFAYCPLFHTYYVVHHEGALNWCRWKVLGETDVLLTDQWIREYPRLKL